MFFKKSDYGQNFCFSPPPEEITYKYYKQFPLSEIVVHLDDNTLDINTLCKTNISLLIWIFWVHDYMAHSWSLPHN